MSAKKVIILGASGNIAKHVIDILIKEDTHPPHTLLAQCQTFKKQRRLQGTNY